VRCEVKVKVEEKAQASVQRGRMNQITFAISQIRMAFHFEKNT
jgi:hypothetical protein